MSLLRVYLDQNAWVRLSRQHYKREHDDRVAGVLALVLEASRTGRVSFPLSASHYEETWRRGDPGSRQRLGAFMAKVSRFHTIAGPVNLLETEVDGALRRLAGARPLAPAPLSSAAAPRTPSASRPSRAPTTTTCARPSPRSARSRCSSTSRRPC